MHKAYSLAKEEKEKFLFEEIKNLTKHHINACKEYLNILKAFNKLDNFKKLEDFFALPVNVFKEIELKSSENIIKILTSSGTSGKASKIFLDKETAHTQTKVLAKILQDFIGKKRLPMLIIDTKSVFKNRKIFSARAAGIMGLMNFGRDYTFVLDDDMNLDEEALNEFLKKHKEFLIFGFTFMVWEYFFKAIKSKNINLSGGILLHSGGWKKLQEKAISNEEFKQNFLKYTGLKKIYNFYGMAEQVGSIFVECEYGHLHTPDFANIIIRDFKTLKPLEFNQEGIIELISVIPKSYPGHVILTEDRGVILGEDDCKCGRKGKYFKVLGRIKKAKIRGCSDTFGSI